MGNRALTAAIDFLRLRGAWTVQKNPFSWAVFRTKEGQRQIIVFDTDEELIAFAEAERHKVRRIITLPRRIP